MRFIFHARPDPFSDPMIPCWRIQSAAGIRASTLHLELDIEAGVCTVGGGASSAIPPSAGFAPSAPADRKRIRFPFELLGTTMERRERGAFLSLADIGAAGPFETAPAGDWIVVKARPEDDEPFLIALNDRYGVGEIVVDSADRAPALPRLLASFFGQPALAGTGRFSPTVSQLQPVPQTAALPG